MSGSKGSYQRARRAAIKAGTWNPRGSGKKQNDAASAKSVKDTEKKTTGAGLPERITGTREERAATFERIDKTYERPPYVKNVQVEVAGSRANINYLDNEFRGIETYVDLPSGRKATPAEIEGAIKWRMYQDRPFHEQRISNFFDEFPTQAMSAKYKAKRGSLTETEKREIYDEANRLVKEITGSGISKKGRELINGDWIPDNLLRD